MVIWTGNYPSRLVPRNFIAQEWARRKKEQGGLPEGSDAQLDHWNMRRNPAEGGEEGGSRQIGWHEQSKEVRSSVVHVSDSGLLCLVWVGRGRWAAYVRRVKSQWILLASTASRVCWITSCWVIPVRRWSAWGLSQQEWTLATFSLTIELLKPGVCWIKIVFTSKIFRNGSHYTSEDIELRLFQKGSQIQDQKSGFIAFPCSSPSNSFQKMTGTIRD